MRRGAQQRASRHDDQDLRRVFPKTNISLRVYDQKARRLRVNVIDSEEMPDVLIGMDYISQGRFTVENVGGEIEVTFEMV